MRNIEDVCLPLDPPEYRIKNMQFDFVYEGRLFLVEVRDERVRVYMDVKGFVSDQDWAEINPAYGLYKEIENRIEYRMEYSNE